MKRWFTEAWTDDVRFSIRYVKRLHAERTPYQRLVFYDSDELGRFFTLDGIMMANEKDEFVYHEMMIHVPLSVHPAVRRVLVIGGGDGGSVRELVRYPRIETIDLVEIDERVVRGCQRYFPVTTTGLADPRVRCHFEDGAAFVKNTRDRYDLVVVDSTDPIGPGEGLFTTAFYRDCERILNVDGILVNQHESPYFANTRREMERAHAKIAGLFPIAQVYQAWIPTYPSGHWLFGFASKRYDPVADFRPGVQQENGIATKYYNGALHKAAFVLPNDVRAALSLPPE